ncbi:ABC transporter ATP-binding protein [Streptomyces malaysiense]|uniref:Multidrug ABC transporter ATP-binding protein n=1 Tax=Streptomyces malaysiense TaxID=1428626 RepID=A0A1J4Q8N0_9ACTN|nr:ABC transporter ATP-binding protein [Streptomyces malaysiense]OIK28726.1 multidrug ABC transporter ATP-binding protein [Streptomyces malaysiense]
MFVRFLGRRLGRYRISTAVILVCQLLQSLATLYLPTLNADVIDNGVLTGDTGYILRVGGLMLAGTLGQVLCSLGAVYLSARVSMGIGRDLRAAIYRRVIGFSGREVGHFGTPSLTTRTTNDVQQVQMIVVMLFTLMVTAPIMCVGGVVMALRQDVAMSSLLLVVVPVLGVAVSLIVRRLYPLAGRLQRRLEEMNRILREQISGVRVIRAFVREDHERRRFTAANDRLVDVSLRMGRIMALMFPTAMLVVYASSVAVMWFGGHRVDDGSLQIGSLTAFLTYLTQILASVMMATIVVVSLPRAHVSTVRIEEVLRTESSVLAPAAPAPFRAAGGLLEVRGAAFRYPSAEEPVLSGVDLVVRPGEVTGVIGSTGSGKTTLLNLIVRLFDVTEGAVLIGGTDVRDLAPEDLSRHVGIVPQRPFLFSGTIATNLRYGTPDADDAELWRALEIAQARDFVERMPGGLDAPVAQGGGNLSGGQRQRLAIARCLVHRPGIYLFDDAFSALDYATDAALRAALAQVTQDAAVVMVAQRVSTIRRADRIVVLDEGRVVGSGTHEQLTADNETYREIVYSQLTEAEAA